MRPSSPISLRCRDDADLATAARRPDQLGPLGRGDEVGALNFLGPEQVLRGAAAVRSGRTFALGIPIASPGGDPVWPGRTPARRFAVQDKSTYIAGHERGEAGEEFADDMLLLYLHGTTHTDALGHMWYDDALYNGYPAASTIGRLERASVLPLARRGIVGRAVLLDIARHRGVARLERGETFGLDDLVGAAAGQGVEVERHDIVLLRTGWIAGFYEDREGFERPPWSEPGLLWSPELVSWFRELEIPALGADTLAIEVTLQPEHGDNSVLHGALMRNLGIAFTEMLWLEDLAADCDADSRWTFLYAGAPLQVFGASGAPTNPLAIR